MSHNYVKYIFLPLIFLSNGYLSKAQNSNKENSPYSRYGIGEFRNGNNTLLKGMGNISSAYVNPYAINADNPASYASLKVTTYEVGAEGSMRTIRANGQSYGTGMASLSYMNIGIPLGKYFGMNIGLRPHTRTYYNMRDTAEMVGLGPTKRSYSGDGSTNYVFFGLAGKYEGFSVGVNFGYLFGNTRHSSILQKVYDTVNAKNTDFSDYLRLGDLYWKTGLLYERKINKNLGLRVGATIILGQDINAWQDAYGISWRISNGSAVYDTAFNMTKVKGNVRLPFTYSLGAHLTGTDKWMAGFDFSGANWSEFRNFGEKDSIANNTYKIAAGAEYTPKATSLYKYIQRITYRVGLYYGTDYVHLRNTTIQYYAFTAGASLPFKRSTDRIHLGMEYGKRGTESNGLIQENFFRFSLGISLNDKSWFIKHKYD